MKPHFLAALLLSGGALAGGGGPSWPLFMEAQTQRVNGHHQAVPFVVDVDFSRVNTFRGGPPRLLVTLLPPGRNLLLTLDSRPLRPREKLHWEGQLPDNTPVHIRVVDEGGGSGQSFITHGQTVRVVITGDARGRWGVSDGHCAPRTAGSCGGGP